MIPKTESEQISLFPVMIVGAIDNLLSPVCVCSVLRHVQRCSAGL